MIISMTGFGRSKKEIETYTITVEIRSVNHRFFDCHVRLPQQLVRLEEKIKKVCQKYLVRGRIDCFVTIDGTNLTNRKLSVDWELIDEYYQFIGSLQERYNLHNDIEISHILQRNEFVTVQEYEQQENHQLERALLQTVEEAAKEVKNMRTVEGKAIQDDFSRYLLTLESEVRAIIDYIPNVKTEYEDKLIKKVTEYTNGLIDETRILTEVAIMIDRSDISEEITRLTSHISQFRTTMNAMEPVGRKFDFLVQEMNREVNTIGSKANNVFISEKVVEMKSIIEKIREQVQNVE